MKTIIPVDEAGRLILPKEIRESLHLHGKGIVSATVTGNRVELEAVPDTPVAVQKVGRFLVIKSSGRPFDTVTELSASREER